MSLLPAFRTWASRRPTWLAGSALLLAGSLPGIWVGSHLMHKTPERVIRSLLSVLLAYAGLKLIAL